MSELEQRDNSAPSQDDPYVDRNLLALALAMAVRVPAPQGTYHSPTVWLTTDPEEPEWPVLMLYLDDIGQISYHLPAELIGQLAPLLHHCDPSHSCWPQHKWDQHSSAEKRDRLRLFIARLSGSQGLGPCNPVLGIVDSQSTS